VRECPACAEQQQAQSSVTNGVLSMVESLRALPSVPLLEPASQQYLLFGLTNGHSSATSQSAVMIEEEPAVPASETIDGLVRPLVESAKATPKFTELKLPDEPPEPPAVVELAASPLSQNPAAAQPPIAAPHNGAKPNPFLARVAQIAELRIPLRTPVAPASPVQSTSLPAAEPPVPAVPAKTEPVTPPVPQVKFVELAVPPIPPLRLATRVELAKVKAAAPSGRTAPAVTQPAPFRARTVRIIGHQPASAKPCPSVASLVPLAGPSSRPTAFSKLRIVESGPFAGTKPESPKLKLAAEPFCAAAGLVEQAGVLSEALALHAESLLDEIKSGLDAVETKIQTIVAAFQTQPKLALLAAPSALVTAPAPPDLQWMKMPRPKLAAHKPSDRKCDRVIAPPQKLPLAGPCLTPELENYIEAPPAERAGKKNGIGLPTWIVSLVIATSLFLAIGVAMQYLATNREAKAAVVPTPPPAAASAPAAPVFEQHPFARFVEVTGLRVVADMNHRSQVQYIVVNHSATQLSGMTIQIAVRSSVDPASSKPLFTVSAVVPSLGPHQSKEIRTDLDSELRNSAIPDWEYLRTEVHVGTQN
jgi:hypothetical protein